MSKLVEPIVPGPSRFVSNLLRKKAITPEMAQQLEQLGNPHLQYQAVMRWRESPDESLTVIIAQLRASQTAHARPDRGVEPAVSGGREKARGPMLRLAQAAFALAVLAAAWWTGGRLADVVARWEPVTAASAPRAPVAAMRPVAPAVPPVPPPIRSLSRARGPRHFAAAVLPSGLVHLSWEGAAQGGARYRLYSSPDSQFRNAQVAQEDLIPMTWLDWMPPDSSAALWLGVKTVLPDGRESALSAPVVIPASVSPLDGAPLPIPNVGRP